MDFFQYTKLTKKSEIKRKPRTKPLPKATDKYLETEEVLFQELEEKLIGYRRKFQFESTRNWRFDFYIVKLNLLIEIAGSPWATGRGGDRRSIEYHITLDMAKELSMVENNAKGREARRYFIAMEKRALGVQQSQPDPVSPALTKEQAKALSSEIHFIKHCFHCTESANQNIMNRLRVDLSLCHIGDIRQCHFDKAMAILASIFEIAKAYQSWQYEVNRMVVDWIIRDGRPWTPEVAKKLRGELDLTINQHPDWNKLALLMGKA